MADIFHSFTINNSIELVFETISTPEGLDKWWTKASSGGVAIGETFHLQFGSDYQWTAIISKYHPFTSFELMIETADKDWEGSKVGFCLTDGKGFTEVKFYHTGWNEENDHFRISNFCWAMYLRILRRNLEFDEFVPYEDRLKV